MHIQRNIHFARKRLGLRSKGIAGASHATQAHRAADPALRIPWILRRDSRNKSRQISVGEPAGEDRVPIHQQIAHHARIRSIARQE